MITSSRKLRPYSHTHTIHSPKASGRLIKWAIELGEFNIKYKPRMAIKAQALADFVVECTIDNQEVGGKEDINKTILDGQNVETTHKEYWTLYFDGASKNNQVELV